MKILGVDFGRRRVGLARATDDGRLADAWRTLAVSGRDDALRRLTALVRDHAFELVVLGHPLSETGEVTDAARRVERFAGVLSRRTGVTVILQDEFATTLEAESLMNTVPGSGAKAGIDAVAAAVILQAYLDGPRATGPSD